MLVSAARVFPHRSRVIDSLALRMVRIFNGEGFVRPWGVFVGRSPAGRLRISVGRAVHKKSAERVPTPVCNERWDPISGAFCVARRRWTMYANSSGGEATSVRVQDVGWRAARRGPQAQR